MTPRMTAPIQFRSSVRPAACMRYEPITKTAMLVASRMPGAPLGSLPAVRALTIGSGVVAVISSLPRRPCGG
jgi:hypothetical protein